MLEEYHSIDRGVSSDHSQIMRWLSFVTLTCAGLMAQNPSPFQPSATIHVYRPKARIKARAVHPSIYCDGVELYRLHQGTVFNSKVSAGKHMISVGRSEVGQLVDLEPGKDYYFRFGHKNLLVTGFSGAQPITLTLVAEEEALPEMRGLKKAKGN